MEEDLETYKKITTYVGYIQKNIGELNHNEKISILQNILNSSIDEKKIQEKGNGTQVKFRDLTPEIIEEIYNFIIQKVQEKTEKLMYITEENFIPD